MGYQNISNSISAEDLQAVKQAFKTINAKLPFLVALSGDEKKGMIKMGPKSIDFVKDCQNVTQNYPEILPPSFDKVELAKDTNLYAQISDLLQLSYSLHEKMLDTSIAVGNEAMTAALQVYDYVKAAAKTEPGLKSIEEQLHQRFKNQGSKRKEE